MKNFSNPECIGENCKSFTRTEVYCIFPTYLNTSLFFILHLLGLILEGVSFKLQPKECLPSAWKLFPHAHSQACPFPTPQSCLSLNSIFSKKSLTEPRMSPSPNSREGYLYLSFALLSSVLPILCYLSHRMIILHMFPT